MVAALYNHRAFHEAGMDRNTSCREKNNEAGLAAAWR